LIIASQAGTPSWYVRDPCHQRLEPRRDPVPRRGGVVSARRRRGNAGCGRVRL